MSYDQTAIFTFAIFEAQALDGFSHNGKIQVPQDQVCDPGIGDVEFKPASIQKHRATVPLYKSSPLIRSKEHPDAKSLFQTDGARRRWGVDMNVVVAHHDSGTEVTVRLQLTRE